MIKGGQVETGEISLQKCYPNQICYKTHLNINSTCPILSSPHSNNKTTNFNT